MKYLSLLLIAALGLASCGEDAKLYRDIDGDWDIEKVERTYGLANYPDSVIYKQFTNVGTISFSKCKKKDIRENAGFCSGSVNVRFNDAGAEVILDFPIFFQHSSIGGEVPKQGILISSSSTVPNPDEFYVTGNWEVESLDDDFCVLRANQGYGAQSLHLKRK